VNVRLAALLVLVCVARAAAHPWHDTYAEVELNCETHALEVAMRIDALELESAVSAWAGRRVTLDDMDDAEPFIAGYLAETVAAADAEGNRAELRWAGIEDELREVWVYFELSFETPPHEIDLVSTALLERNPYQTTTVSFRSRVWSGVVLLTGDEPLAALPGEKPEL